MELTATREKRETSVRTLAQLPIACSTVPLVLQATGSCLETKVAYLRPESRPRYYFQEVTSLVWFLGSPQKAKRGLGTSVNHLHSALS